MTLSSGVHLSQQGLGFSCSFVLLLLQSCCFGFGLGPLGVELALLGGEVLAVLLEARQALLEAAGHGLDLCFGCLQLGLGCRQCSFLLGQGCPAAR